MFTLFSSFLLYIMPSAGKKKSNQWIQDPNDKIAPWYALYPLKDQHEKKKDHLLALLENLGIASTFRGLRHLPPYTHYRNNNKFTFGYRLSALDKANGATDLKEDFVVGFIGGAYPLSYIVPASGAITIPLIYQKIAERVLSILKKSPFKPFLAPPRRKRKRDCSLSYTPHHGVWHHLKIRHTRSGKFMLLLANFTRHIRADNMAPYQATLEALVAEFSTDPSVVLGALQSHHATFYPQPHDPIEILWDRTPNQRSSLCESLGDKKFLIAPTSFFQVNTVMAEALYQGIYALFESLMENHPPKRKKILLDLYCGGGSIGLFCANLFDEIIGIDEVEAAIERAEANRLLNGVDHARYIAARCEASIEIIENMLQGKAHDLYIVVNPSRDGLHKKVRRFLRKIPNRGVVYSSCNGETWARDVAHLMRSEVEKSDEIQRFEVKESTIYDLFPHTPHYEVLTLLRSYPLLGAKMP